MRHHSAFLAADCSGSEFRQSINGAGVLMERQHLFIGQHRHVDIHIPRRRPSSREGAKENNESRTDLLPFGFFHRTLKRPEKKGASKSFHSAEQVGISD